MVNTATLWTVANLFRVAGGGCSSALRVHKFSDSANQCVSIAIPIHPS